MAASAKWIWKVFAVGATVAAAGGVLASRPTGPAGAGPTKRFAPVAASCAPPRMLDLGMRTCRPCKMMLEVLAELDAEYAGRLRSEFIDIGEQPDQQERYGVRVIPTQIFYDRGGVEFFRHEGFLPKAEVLAQFERRGIDVSGRCQDSR